MVLSLLPFSLTAKISSIAEPSSDVGKHTITRNKFCTVYYTCANSCLRDISFPYQANKDKSHP